MKTSSPHPPQYACRDLSTCRFSANRPALVGALVGLSFSFQHGAVALESALVVGEAQPGRASQKKLRALMPE